MRHASRVLLAVCFVSLMATLAAPAWAQDSAKPDPAGAATGTAADAQNAGGAIVLTEPTDKSASDYAAKLKAYQDEKTQIDREPFAKGLADGVGQNRIAINLVWTLVTGYLVMFMQAGFALVETGFCRKKNAAHVMMTNFMIYPLGMLGFFILGFGLMFGAVGAVGSLGGTSPLTSGHFFGPSLHGVTMGLLAWNPKAFLLSRGVYDVGVFTLFLFQMVFMDTTATIPTGAMAERWKFTAFMVYGLVISMFIYPIYGSWVWGGGWLAMLGQAFGMGNGAADFAGSGVVHMVGGMVGLAGAIVLGPRIGKYSRDGKPNPMPGHNIPMALLGTFILAFGWFGFNPGSTLGASGGGLLRIGIIATATMLASATGAVAAVLYMMARTGKPDPSMAANGMLAGLVAITAPSGWVDAWGACIIGAVAGVLVCVSVFAIEKAGVDDPVGAVSVHGVCGAWGVLSVGLFADGTFGGGLNGVAHNVTGLFYGGGASQLLAQVIDVAVCAVWSFGVGYVFFKIQDKIMGIRSKKEDELEGLDLPEMGVEAYPEDAVKPGMLGGATPAGLPAASLAASEA